MQIRFWGTRGSLPAPINNKEYRDRLYRILELSIKNRLNKIEDIDNFITNLPNELQYLCGGDTTCVSVKSNSGKLYIIDCGTGLRRLGDFLMMGECSAGKGELNIMITHNHWDHIQGLPFFKPIYIAGNILNIYSPYENQQAALENQMASPYFPAKFQDTPSTKNYYLIEYPQKNPLQLEEDLFLSIYPLKHPQGCYAYKFVQNNKSFIFATDAEFTGEAIESSGATIDFFTNADILVLDSQYTLDEAFIKVDWGHTSYTMAVNCASNWNINKLILTHHEPAYSDDILQSNHLLALEHAQLLSNIHTEILLGREGMIFDL
ncbi:MAG: MBL fold metallo-hydrolase [Spirochaetes bacterium]|nr:MBL fold metallo-hydrolase [Spirochaetota bacterium]